MQNNPIPYLTISEINQNIKQTLDSSIGIVRIKGEISSITFHNTGHIYFSLKDPKAQIDGVIFKNMVKSEFLTLQVGDFVYAMGTITSYIKTGKMSFQSFYISAKGQGALQLDFHQLKNKLESEGIFTRQKILSLSSSIKKMAIITAPEAAALTDFLTLIQSRLVNNIEIIIIPTLMQGEKAVLSIIESLKVSEQLENIDCILITRGGGAYEDLAPFNNENLVRTIAAHPQVIISAIGHEQDYTLTDFVAYNRFETPSAAALILFSQKEPLLAQLKYYKKSLAQNLELSIKKITFYLEHLKESLNFQLTQKLQYQQLKISYLKKSLDNLNPKVFLDKGYVFIQQHNSIPFKKNTPIQIQDTLILQTLQGQVHVQVVQLEKTLSEDNTENY